MIDKNLLTADDPQKKQVCIFAKLIDLVCHELFILRKLKVDLNPNSFMTQLLFGSIKHRRHTCGIVELVFDWICSCSGQQMMSVNY